MSVPDAIDYWFDFLTTLNIVPDYVTIHSDKPEWKDYYSKYNIEVRFDKDCIWSDGSKDSVSSYCTEFYKDNIEIGNIVNPYGTSIDCGFGKNRLEMVMFNMRKTRQEVLIETIMKIINSGFAPTYNKQGSLLRKLLRICYLEKIEVPHQFYQDEINRQEKIINKYNRMKENPKFKNKDKQWWFNTLGIDLDLL
jgi:hypothetical protein